MPDEKTAARYYRFGEYEVDSVKRLLFRHRQRVALTSKAFDVLWYSYGAGARLPTSVSS
jgi:DNA-binding response OmpR family regulator